MLRAGAAATLGCAAAVAALEVPDCEIHFIVAACENAQVKSANLNGTPPTRSQ